MRLDFKDKLSKKYKLKLIWNSMVYVQKTKLDYLPKFYYLICEKRYLKEKNI